MYKVGNMVMHPYAGVCMIKDVRIEKFSKLPDKMYYILNPIYEQSQSRIYVPVDSEKIQLRKLLSMEDIQQLIHSIDLDTHLWVNNDSKRQEKFNQILKSGNHKEIIQLIVEIHNKEYEKKQENKKLHLADIRIMQEAEKMIHQEFAFSLNLKIDEVASFIMKELHIEDHIHDEL